ncbi:hypothetical protein CQA53_08015 [Helicobacter didelphidarum]|uniref:Uncharacterized protein n=1 Tax=Helicobacter didelphidarum TaxID=2040648 RepID=A0A3D8IHD2_9HELI|nr:hypothetical protein [Helicobacter didelphidarum]RDU64074.1 hypothetical protein CQA53_08015 [Helicobacter didelphidarum]
MLNTVKLGGWTSNEKPFEISKEAKQAFDGATNNVFGVRYELMLHLGTQIVAGRNYAFICRSESTTLNPKASYVLMIVYASLGECEKVKYQIAKIKKLVKQKPKAHICGGIVVTKADQALIKQLDCIEANHILSSFENAFKNMKGVSYSPELYVAHQVTQGINYHIIAKATLAGTNEVLGFRYVVFNSFMDENTIISIKHI